MTCKEAIEKLADYLDRELTPDVLRRIDVHLEVCAPCRAYLATYRKTKDLVAKVNGVEMPEDLRRRLSAFLVDQIRRMS